MFRAAMCPSSGELIVSIRHLVYFTLYRWPFGVQVWMRRSLIQICTPDGHLYKVTFVFCPKSNENNFLNSAEGPGKESEGQGRWRGNSGVQFDLPQVSPRLCSSRYVSKVHSSFCVLSRAKMQSLEQRYAIKFCLKLGKSGSETLQLLRTAYRDAVLPSAQSSDGIRRSRTEGRALRTNGAQGLQLQELRTMWLVWRLFWIGTVVWVCG